MRMKDSHWSVLNMPKNIRLSWVKQAWRNTPEELVRQLFETCGICNTLDGTEDDTVYSDEIQDLEAENEEDAEDEFDTISKKKEQR